MRARRLPAACELLVAEEAARRAQTAAVEAVELRHREEETVAS